MSINIEALKAPTQDTLDEWLNTPRPARCGELFKPSEPMWNPDKFFSSRVNWQAAILSVPIDWQSWLHAALAYRMVDISLSTVNATCSVLSRAAQAGLNPLKINDLIDIREKFSKNDLSMLVSFMEFWMACESLEKRPSLNLINAYRNLPKKRHPNCDPILSLDPVKGPFTQMEQDALHQWLHEQFCQNNLEPEQYFYARLLMLYGLRTIQIRMMIFDDFIKCEQGYKVRLFWAKQKFSLTGFREKSETFTLDEDFYNIIQAYQALVLARLKQEYPGCVDWDKAIKNVPLFRRKFTGDYVVSRKRSTPVLIDDPDHKSLEVAPHARFHISSSSIKSLTLSMESMAGFPISTRTHLPLKISKGHRFRYTLGTDLSNAGFDEWAIAQALLHKNTKSVRKYRQVSAELMSRIDDKMSDHLALVVNAFNGTIVKDRASAKNGTREDRQVEDLAVCGADSTCHLETPFSCYACSKFQPLLDANHNAALERMERRREQTIAIDKTTGVIWDRAILACRKIIIECNQLRSSSRQDKTHE